MSIILKKITTSVSPFPWRRRGAALIITLAAITLMTVLIITFFSKSLLNRRVAEAATQSIRAEQLARYAADHIIAQLREQIRTDSTVITAGSSNIYWPATDEDSAADPARVLAEDLFPETSTPQPALKLSANGDGITSDASTDTTSRNGRQINNARWFNADHGGPGLNDPGTTPEWAIITANNGIVVDPTINQASDPTDDNFAVGRFSFVSYDLSGLLDLNVAGYPSGGVLGTSDIAQKTSMAYTDLESIDSTTGITTSDLVAWRNKISATDPDAFNKWATGIEEGVAEPTHQRYLAAARSGYLSAPEGDNTFINRRDLVLAATAGEAGLSTNSLPYITHFSRASNSPAWAPVSPTGSTITYEANQTDATATNRMIQSVRVTSNTLKRRDLSIARVGEPLIQSKFPLDKITLLQGATSAEDYDTSEIFRYFGLIRSSVDDPWEYPVSLLQGSQEIMTLEQVAAANREPNFFELLKAGILEGSLGSSATADTNAGSYSGGYLQELNKDFHILKIGANIIDCADTDNFPTLIESDVLNEGFNVAVAGIEDLPYIFELVPSFFFETRRPGSSTTDLEFAWKSIVVVPVLFNPHAVSPVAATDGTPANIRLRVLTGAIDMIYLPGRYSQGSRGTPLADMTLENGTIDLSMADPNAFRNSPDIDDSGGAQSIGTLSGQTIAADTTDLQAFLIYNDTTVSASFTPTGNHFPIMETLDDIFIVLEYEDASGGWKIYDSICGYEADTTTGFHGRNGNGQVRVADTVTTSPQTSNSIFTGFSNAQCYVKVDPRSTRYSTMAYAANANNGTFKNGDYTSASINREHAFAGLSASSSFEYVSWPQGGRTRDTPTNYANAADADGAFRPADAFHSDDANPLRDITDTARRPVILQRMYRNVAELGYVFRDQPWKSLSMSTADSADAGLAELFTVSGVESPIVAGKINPNRSTASVLQALIEGITTDPSGSDELTGVAAIANSLVSEMSSSPVVDNSQFAGLVESYGSGDIKNQRESLFRGISQMTQMRTWNLLIDVVAQSGRYPIGSADLDSFVVEGEKRYWISVALDRYTNKVIDYQIELAN